MSFTCVRCGRTFSDLKNALPETAFEPPADQVDPKIAAQMAEVKGMTQLAKRDVPKDEVARTGYFLIMVDGTLHEFPGAGQ